jgi:hypothetical protein
MIIEKKIPLIYSALPSIFILIFLIGFNYGNNGVYARKVFTYGLLLSLHLYILIKLTAFMYKHFSFLTLVFLFISFSFSASFFIFKIKLSCSEWDLGLGGVRIDNDHDCKVKYPNICYIDLFLHWFDFSAFNNNETCEEIKNNNFNLIRPYLTDPKTKKIGFPRTENYAFFNQSELVYFTKTVRGDLTNIESSINPNAFEVIVNYYDSRPKVTISLKRNESLIKERKEKNKEGKMYKNVFIIYIDSLSRTHFRRQLGKTFSWFESKYNNSSSKYETFQFLKYHTIGTTTRSNMIPGFFGTKENGPSFGRHFIEDYKNNGYITGNAMDYCAREVFEGYSAKEKEYLGFSAFDHELVSLFCDPNFGDLFTGGYYLNGPYGIRKQCLYSKNTHEYVFEYIKQFWNAYIDQPKLFRFGSMEGHEQSGEVIRYIDDNLISLLKFFEEKGYLQDTLLMFLSDHGLMQTGIPHYIQADDFIIEKHLPTLLLLMDKSTLNYTQIKENLKVKEQKMVTAYDIYNTLVSIPTTSKKGLFWENDNSVNSCQKLEIPSNFCKCSTE